jgi:hypothetical protein
LNKVVEFNKYSTNNWNQIKYTLFR